MPTGLQPATGNTLHDKYLMIYKLDLPKPSEKLVKIVMHYAKQSKVDIDTLRWHKEIQNPTVNCAYGDFFSYPDITYLAKEEYQQYFKREIFPIVGVITNTDSSRTASYPPHTDRVRTVGINFYIDLGGENVQTVFYTEQDTDNTNGKVLPYEKLTVDTQFNFSTDTWYAINTRQYHSVENIETTRYMLTLSVLDTDFNDLKDLVSCTGIEPV